MKASSVLAALGLVTLSEYRCLQIRHLKLQDQMIDVLTDAIMDKRKLIRIADVIKSANDRLSQIPGAMA